jgi:hypothetical protein
MHEEFLDIIERNLECEEPSFLYSLHEKCEIDYKHYMNLMGCLHYFKAAFTHQKIMERFDNEEYMILLKVNKICSGILRKTVYRFGNVDPEPFKLGKLTREKFVDEYLDPLIRLSEEITKIVIKELSIKK